MNKKEIKILSDTHRESQLAGDLIGIDQICSLSTKEFLLMEKVKIKEMDNEVLAGLLPMMISKISGLCGIKEDADPFTMNDVSKLILSLYKSYSIADIWKAFELERYGEYDSKTDHFQLFNAQYVSSIMIKYKEWRAKKKKQYNISALIEALNMEVVQELPPPEKSIEDIANECFVYFKKNGRLPNLFFGYWRKIYFKVFEDTPLTQNEIEKYRLIGISNMKEEHQGIIKRMMPDSFDYKCKRESTRIAVIGRFKKIINDKK